MNIKSLFKFLSNKTVKSDTRQITITNPNDKIFIDSNSITVIFQNTTYNFEISDLDEAILFTTDQGPIYDDMGVALKFADGFVVNIMSMHPSFKSFLFDELGKRITIDYSAIIAASSCTENAVFPLYKKDDSEEKA